VFEAQKLQAVSNRPTAGFLMADNSFRVQAKAEDTASDRLGKQARLGTFALQHRRTSGT
jgi:hypothetical protein